MLEALIDINAPDAGAKAPGDVIVLALSRHPWGIGEREEFAVLAWNDPDWEATLVAAQTTENPWPIASYPYVELNEGGDMVTRSLSRVDPSDPAIVAEMAKPVPERGVIYIYTVPVSHIAPIGPKRGA
jgi:hypothetical protein